MAEQNTAETAQKGREHNEPVEQKLAKKKYESPRQLERQATILTATREMLAEVGYSATTMRDLAQKANVAPGTLYNLYKSKDALVFAAVEDLLNQQTARAVEASPEGLERILARAEESAASIQNNPAYAEAMTRALFTADSNDVISQRLYSRGTPAAESQIKVAIDNGQLESTTSSGILARQITAQTWGVIVAWVMGSIDLRDFRTELLRAQIVILLSAASGDGRNILLDYLESI